ncbi:MAG: diguanylate cyclase [Hyphomicrobiaceae bacterium]|nr:diguanylate cyclase [Hyphomicrobiaceae bacterium]
MLIQATSEIDKIEALIHASVARRLFGRWKAMNASGALPAGEAFRVPLLGDATDFCMILSPLDGTFHYTYYGRAIINLVGYDMTDRTVRDLGGDLSATFEPQYRAALETRQPVYFTFRSMVTTDVHRWERLVLPVTHGENGIRLIVFTKPVFMLGELLNSVFAASHDGILALSHIEGQDRADDFLIELANESASIMLDRPEGELFRQRASVVFDGDALSPLLDACRKVTARGAARSMEVPVASEKGFKTFRAAVNPMPGGVVLTLADISKEVGSREELRRQRDEMRFTTETLEANAARLADLAEELETAHGRLSEEIRQREVVEAELRVLAETDALTGLFNRRRFFAQAETEMVRARRMGSKFSLAVIDIDHFKQINDTYGHNFGDAILTSAADQMCQVLRTRLDILGRIGGEEFAVLMPGSDTEGARHVAERLREACTLVTVGEGKDAQAFSITVSIGVAEFDGDVTIDALYHRADCALYEAKRAGRDRVEVGCGDRSAA